MTIDAFRLKNFMAFRDTGWIELRAITLLFGRNSSGKSAIIRALRLLKQSLYNGHDNEVLRFAVEGQLDLGDFQAALHRRPDPDDEVETIEGRKISFAFRGDLLGNEIVTVRRQVNQYLASLGYSSPISADYNAIDFELEFGYNYLEHRVQLVGVHIDCPWPELEAIGKTNFLSASRISLADDAGTKWQMRWFWESDLGLAEIIAEEDLPWETIQIVIENGFMPALETSLNPFERQTLLAGNSLYEALIRLLSTASKSVEGFLNRIEYLGPIRPEPQRLYLLDKFLIQRLQQQGLGAWIALLRGSSSIDQVLMSGWLQRFGLGVRLHIVQFPLTIFPSASRGFDEGQRATPAIRGNSINLPEIVAQIEIEQDKSNRVNLKDVGYGASQVLPIIASCLEDKEQRLVIIEQPELHLHPGAQALLGDLFINAHNSSLEPLFREQDKSRITREKYVSHYDWTIHRQGTKFLIETHSEHLLLRLRRRIAETSAKSVPVDPVEFSLDSNMTEVYFVAPESQMSVIFQAKLNHLGDLPELPDDLNLYGFFADDLDETAALVKARIKIKRFSQ